jgi:hypothetical protein
VGRGRPKRRFAHAQPLLDVWGRVTGQASGHTALVQRQRGARWYARGRFPDGKPFQKCLGPAWQGKGRPRAGFHTQKTAEAALRHILTDAERGTLAIAQKTGATFKDAVEEWLRYVEHDRKRRPSTVRDYKNVASQTSSRVSMASLRLHVRRRGEPAPRSSKRAFSRRAAFCSRSDWTP